MNKWEEVDLSVLAPATPGWHADDPVMLEKLETSLKTFGQLQPLVVKDGKVLNGRNLLRAMLNLGWKTGMAVSMTGDADPLRVGLATEIKFDTDYAKLAEVIRKRADGEHHSLARISPFSAKRIEYFDVLADFDWSSFKETDDQGSLWGDDDFVKPKGQAPSPKVKPEPAPKVDRPRKAVTSGDRKPAPAARPAPLPRPARPPVATLSSSSNMASLAAPIEVAVAPPEPEPEPEPPAPQPEIRIVPAVVDVPPPQPAPVVTPEPPKVNVFDLLDVTPMDSAKPVTLSVPAPPPPKRATNFDSLLDRQQTNLMSSVLFSGHEAPRHDPNWRPDPLPSLADISEIEFDTETTGLRWFKGDRPIGAAVRLPDGTKRYIAWGHAGGNSCDEGTAKRWAQRELRNKHLTGANIKFDVHMMREWGIDLEEQGCTLSDVLHMAPLLDDTRRKWSLDTVAEEYKVLRKTGQDLDKSRMAEYHASIVAPYAMNDVEMTHQAKLAMWPHLDDQDMHVVRLLEESIIYAVAEMERNAAPLDVELLERWVGQSEREVNSLLKELVDGCGFMMNPEKDGDWIRLFEKLGLPITHFTDKGAPSFADAVIKRIEHPLVQKARRITKINSIRSKFLLPYADDVREYGLLRFALHQLRGDKNGTVRGRFSASDQNIQQVFNAENQRKAFGYEDEDSSHDDEIYLIRKLFVAGAAGYKYKSSDAMQIEYRIMAHLAGDPRMLEAYAKDPLLSYHNLVGDMVMPLVPDIRYGKIKILNFMLMYGGGKDKTAETLELPRDRSDAFVALYKSTFPYTDKLFKRVMAEAEEQGFVSTLLGRRARFKNGKFSHAALNAVIQGTAADIMKMKIAEVHAARKKTGFIMRMTVHDELCGDSPSDESTAMVNAILNEQSLALKVPILWKTKTGNNWAEC